MAEDDTQELPPEKRLRITVQPGFRPGPVGPQGTPSGGEYGDPWSVVEHAPLGGFSNEPPGAGANAEAPIDQSGWQPVDHQPIGAAQAAPQTAEASPLDQGGWKPVSTSPFKGDLRDWPLDYSVIRNEGTSTINKGLKQLGTTGERVYGAGNTALGALEFTTSPIQAGLRSMVGRPLEQRTGIPKEYTEFAAGLAIPGYGLPRLPGTKQAAHVIRQMVAPEAVSPAAERAAGTLRQSYGAAARDTATTEHALTGYNAPFTQRVGTAAGKLAQGKVGEAVDAFFDNYARQIAKLPPQQQLALIDHIEGGASQIHPSLAPVANELKAAFEARKAKLQSMPSTSTATFIQDYFPHFWKDPNAAANATFGKAGKQGSGASLKKRTIPTIADGIAAGLTPISTNPIEMALRYINSMDNFIAATQALEAGKAAGDVRYIRPKTMGASGHPNSFKVPPGWAPLQGRGAVKQTPAGPMHAYAPEDWALVYNNFVGKGVYGTPEYGKAYDSYMRASNFHTAFLLGMSGYHAFTMATEGFLSALARGVGEIYTGVRRMQPGLLKEGAQTLASAPFKPFTSPVTGKKVQDAYRELGTHSPQFKEIVDLLEKGGGRAVGAKHAQDYQFSRQGSYWNSWQRGALKTELLSDWKDFKGNPLIRLAPQVANHAARIMSTIAGPLFEHYIPLMKNGAFYDTMYSWLQANPSASQSARIAAARKILDTIDNRLGETVQQNIFWKQGAKQFAQAALLSYSWNLGTIREIGGGAKDLLMRGPKALDLTSKEFSPRAAYVIAFPVGIAAINSFYQYLKTGQLPGQTSTPGRDMAAPRTGGTAPPIGGEHEPRLTKKGVPYKGDRPARTAVPERAIVPGYQKDVFGWYAHPGQEFFNKIAPLAKMLYSTVTNSDWAGNPIINWNDPPPEWLKQYLTFVVNSYTPITVGQMSKSAKPGTAITSKELSTGIRAAPSWLQDPENYKASKEYRQQKAQERKEKFESPTKYEDKAKVARERREKNKKILEQQGGKVKQYGGPQ